MTDEQIETMLQMHRYLIHCEMSYLVDKMNQNDRAAELTQKVNDEEWTKFSLWLRSIRDE